MLYTLTFQPSGRRCTITEKETILDTARKNGIDLAAACGGGGVCGKCRVRIDVQGVKRWRLEDKQILSPVTAVERRVLSKAELAGNYRLACMTRVFGNAAVFVPEQSRSGQQVILESAKEELLEVRPSVQCYALKMTAPTLTDYRDDQQRVFEAIAEASGTPVEKLSMDFMTIRKLPQVLRRADWQITAVVSADMEVIDVRAGRNEAMYGVAIDLGTTTLAATLCELTTGKRLKRKSRMNGQISYGDDVISRISYIMLHDDGLDELQRVIIDDINGLIRELADEAEISLNDIFEIVVVGNTVMEHIFLGINPESIGKAPFTATLRKSIDVKARELSIEIAYSGNVHLLPVEAGFVGADNVAVLLAGEPYKQSEMVLTVDIGTNGEIDFGNSDKLWSTSCATGPALEGAQLTFGMRAATGAIEKVKIDEVTGEPKCQVIGNVSPKGICGSGIIDIIAEFVRTGIILEDGKFNSKLEIARLRPVTKRSSEYVLVWAKDSSIGKDIIISQKDIRAIQLAKGALYAGAKLLMQSSGAAIDKIVLAGAFGSYIDKKNAVYIGMLPQCALSKVEVVGNAASEGAVIALLDRVKRQEADMVARNVEFIEAADSPDFQKLFFEGLMFRRDRVVE